MTDKRVRDMSAASALGGTELFYADDGASDTKVTANQIARFSHELINIKDFGAVGDNIADDGPAFDAFNAAYAGDPEWVSLYIPAGTYNISTNVDPIFYGIPKIQVFGYGASLTQHGGLGTPPFSGQDFIGGQDSLTPTGFPNFTSALINTAEAGATSITLVNPGDVALFSVGDWIMVSGLEIQGSDFPPNFHFNEFVEITDIVGSDLTLGFPLKNTYLDTWPFYASGGPATIFRMDPSWNTEISIHGVHFVDEVSGGSFCTFEGKVIRLFDCTFEQEPLLHIGKERIFERCVFAPTISMEIDKLVEDVTFNHCVIPGLFVQSSSVNRMTFNSCEIGSNGNSVGLKGTGRNTTIRDSIVTDLQIGPLFYGQSESLLIENSKIINVTVTELNSAQNAISTFTIANGTLTRPLGSGPAQFAVPGGKVLYHKHRAPPGVSLWFAEPFVIKTIGTDGSNTVIETTLPEPAPVFTGAQTPTLFIAHPCPHVTLDNCTGHSAIRAMSQVASPRPFFSYTKELLIDDASASGPAHIFPDNISARGFLVSLTVDVIRAYTGTVPSLEMDLSGGIEYNDASLAFNLYNPTFDLTTTGKRTIIPGTVTGAVGTDSIPVPAVGTWLMTDFQPLLSDSITGETPDKFPIIAIELITDQGIVAYDWIPGIAPYAQS